MKIALIHDDFCQLGGAERLFEGIAKIYPEAPIYTSLVNWDKIPESIDKNRIHTSFMQKIPLATLLYKALLPLYPFAFESFDLSRFDVVISSTTRFAKSIVTGPHTTHICYINSTPRFLYHEDSKESYLPPFLKFLFAPVFWWLRRWDKVAAQRVDLYIANSQNVQKSIFDQYGCESTVVYPFADTGFFKPAVKQKKGDYFLVVSRLVKWKKIDLAIKACGQLNQPLFIIGKGPHEAKLKSIAGRQGPGAKNIKFLSNTSPGQLKSFYQNAKALIVTQEEDFGIATVEAQACGKPVIAFAKGGQAEIIKDKITGILFPEQTVQSLKDAIYAHSRLKWDVSAIRNNVEKFSKENFVKSLQNEVKLYAGKR